MKRKQFSEDQIVRIQVKFEQGKSVEELCREYNVARSTIYMWRKKYGGIDKPMLKKYKEMLTFQFDSLLRKRATHLLFQPDRKKLLGNSLFLLVFSRSIPQSGFYKPQ
jgi:predicted DNA-binding protein YlxM (UPF0122 family)